MTRKELVYVWERWNRSRGFQIDKFEKESADNEAMKAMRCAIKALTDYEARIRELQADNRRIRNKFFNCEGPV